MTFSLLWCNLLNPPAKIIHLTICRVPRMLLDFRKYYSPYLWNIMYCELTLLFGARIWISAKEQCRSLHGIVLALQHSSWFFLGHLKPQQLGIDSIWCSDCWVFYFLFFIINLKWWICIKQSDLLREKEREILSIQNMVPASHHSNWHCSNCMSVSRLDGLCMFPMINICMYTWKGEKTRLLRYTYLK